MERNTMVESASTGNRAVITFPDRDTMHQAVAARLLLTMSECLARRSRFDVALTGGSDGIAVLRAMAGHPLATAVDWSRVHLWWGDERFVLPDDGDRNAGQAREAWFGALVDAGLLPEANVHEMPADDRPRDAADAASDMENDTVLDAAAADYRRELEDQLGADGAFDVAMFGIGPDGHFASLFPDRDEVRIDDPDAWTVGVSHSPKMPPLRISLTVPFITRSHEVWMIASKEGKAEAVSRALGAARDPHVPSSYAAGAEKTLWFLDRDAAARL